MARKSEHKFQKLTAKMAALWVGEAWGRDISPRDVRVRNNWVFVRDVDYPGECDALFSPHGNDLHGEPWDNVAIGQSPFVVKDTTAIKALTDKLDAEYKKHLAGCGYEAQDLAELFGQKLEQ